MKISTKGRYGVRLMIDLAIHNTGEAVKLKDISLRQEISEKYLEQIVASLNKAGFVRSIRGAQGGYVLAKDPQQITVGDILRTIEGSLAPVECLMEGAPVCPREAKCVTVKLWRELYDAINNVVDKYTIADLANKQKSEVLDFII